jgi:hypothetical protein
MRQPIEIARIRRWRFPSRLPLDVASRARLNGTKPRRRPQRPELHPLSGIARAAFRCGIGATCTTLATLIGFACATPRDDDAVRIEKALPPSSTEQYCAWYGDRRDDVLYFGESPFWNAMRAAGGDPMADSHALGPQVIGRFDLRRESMLASVPTAARDPHAGVWDVLAHPNGRVYYTTFYESAGWVDPATGEAKLFEVAGTGLNELALRPDGRVLATRYGAGGGGNGSVVVLDPDGVIEAELPLVSERNVVAAAKSLAYDPVRQVVWVNTDLVPRDGGPSGHDARVLEFATGREILRIEAPELHFPRFTRDGRGFFAWQQGSRLWLRMTQPGAAQDAASGREVVLDTAFADGVDFVQDVHVETDGRAVVTRWSGVVHVVAPDGSVRSVDLPRSAAGGLYYTAVAVGDRVCATYCADVSVVCAALP